MDAPVPVVEGDRERPWRERPALAQPVHQITETDRPIAGAGERIQLGVEALERGPERKRPVAQGVVGDDRNPNGRRVGAHRTGRAKGVTWSSRSRRPCAERSQPR